MKRIASIQDISCLGRCSLTVALPVISAMAVECAIVPTAVLSTHTMFPGFISRDLSDQLLPIARHWKSQNVTLDAICTGYLASPRQTEEVCDFFDLLAGPDTLLFVDPAMADGGNDNGTAPGIIMEKNGKMIVMLPGPPRETIPMFQNQVKPYLAKKQEFTFVSRILRVAEVGESAMEERVKDIIDAQTNPTIAPYAKDGEAILRITAKARDEEEANRLIDPVAAVLKERLGDAVYGEGETDLETVVAEQLLQKQLTLAVAESCTGGMIASNLVEYPGISAALVEGCVTYSNEAKMHRLGVKAETLEKYGAVSEETAKEMAEGIARTSGADIGLATTGVAGPESSEGKPVGLVYIAIAYKGKTEVYTCHFVGKRNKIRERAAYTALNWLRKVINDEA